MAAIDISVIKAHSVRGASTSKAIAMGLSTKDILKRGNCSRQSTSQKDYRKDVVSYSRNFQEKLLHV